MTMTSLARALRPSLLFGLAAVAAALLAAGPAHGDAGVQICPPGLPFVLNVALPAGEVVDRAELARLRDELASLFERGLLRLQPCVFQRGLQVNVALGSDYQVLHWLEQGAVDLAVVSELALHLLRRSGLELLEPGASPAALVPARRGRLLSRSAGGGERPDAEGDFRAFLGDVWRLSGAAGEAGEAAVGIRLELGSHLDTARFLVPVAAAQRWLQAAHGAASPQRQERFWARFFDSACLVFPGDRRAPEDGVPCHGPDRAAAEAGERAVLLVVEEVVPPAPSTGAREPVQLAFGTEVRDRLVIRSGPAARLLAGQLRPARGRLPPEVLSLVGSAAPGTAEGRRVPSAFGRLADAEPTLGVRTFAFTPEETVRLLWSDQRVSGRSRLGLVLPGGGVKAAYQSRVAEALYQEGYLKNAGARVAPGSARRPLDVDTVIGTSGGALLGFFVARLGELGPWNLSCLLWSKREACRSDDELGFLDSSDIFPGLDLLRYLSLVVVFLVLSLLLTIFGLRPGARLAPDHPTASAGRRAIRLQWGLLAASVLALTPVLVRLANGDQVVEHIPEVQGLLFFVLTLLVVFADQCLVLGGPPPRRLRSLRLIGMTLILVSVVAVALPLVLLGESSAGFLADDIPFWLGYLLLALPLVGAVVALRFLRWLTVLGTLLTPARLAAAVGELTVASVAAFALLLPLGFLGESAGRRPTLVIVLALMVVLIGLGRLLWTGSPGRGRMSVAYYPALLLAAILAMVLAAPAARDVAADGLGALLTAPAGLDAPLGGLLVSLGALGLLLGQVVALTAWAPHYRVEHFVAFLHAIGLALFHASLALGLVWLASLVAGHAASFFELTGAYWLWLLAAALALGLALIAWGLWGGRPRRLVAAIRTGVDFLCSPHPNGRLVRRRYARVLMIGAGSLVWWNLVLAPAAYGNGEAFEYLNGVARRFDRSYLAAYPQENAYRLRARFLTPANALEQDGTRFFLFVPQDGDCPVVAQRPGSGGTWQRFRVLVGKGQVATDRGCEPLDLRGSDASADRDREYLRNVVFASGSPFPVFPAHRVRRGEAEAEPLVDGGYTNNLPLDPALALGLEQVLILQSSHPYPVPPGAPAGVRMLAGVPGPLVKQLFRLPGYLYGRSQQLDRRSRGALFVASLAPSAEEHDWPFLTDFRSRRVRQMLTTAERDLGRRIGAVESWGPPSFQGSVIVAGTANGHPAR